MTARDLWPIFLAVLLAAAVSGAVLLAFPR